jgi:hypothetical protein
MGQAEESSPKESGKIKEAIWTNADLDVLEFLVAKKARSYVFGWITILSAIVAVGALIGWSGINSVQESLNRKAEALDKQALSLDEKSKKLDKTLDSAAGQLSDRFRSLTKEQEAIINDFRSHQDQIVQASREDEREIRRSTDTTRESVFGAQQSLFNSQRELVATMREIRDHLETTKTSAEEAKKARGDLQSEVENTRKITDRMAVIEKEVLRFRDQIERAATGYQGDHNPAMAPTNPGTKRMRPAMGGDSIGGANTNAQTIGCLVKDREGNLYILTIAGSFKPGDDVLQPGPLDGGQPGTDVIAKLERVIEAKIGKSNQAMGALAKILDPSLVSAEIRGIGKLRGTAEPRLLSSVQKWGRTTGWTKSRISSIEMSVSIEYPEGTATFEDLIATDHMTSGGDSGAILVDENNYAVGLAFAGSTTQSLFLPIRKVLDALGVSLVTEL